MDLPVNVDVEAWALTEWTRDIHAQPILGCGGSVTRKKMKTVFGNL